MWVARPAGGMGVVCVGESPVQPPRGWRSSPSEKKTLNWFITPEELGMTKEEFEKLMRVIFDWGEEDE